jgi:hypothetical protein
MARFIAEPQGSRSRLHQALEHFLSCRTGLAGLAVGELGLTPKSASDLFPPAYAQMLQRPNGDASYWIGTLIGDSYGALAAAQRRLQSH